MRFLPFFICISLFFLSLGCKDPLKFKQMQMKAKAVEVSVALASIRIMQMSYHADYGHYVPVSPYPCPATSQGQVWMDKKAGQFSTLGFKPLEKKVLGCYRVEVSQDGKDFKVIGELDLDGDGKKRIYEASKDQKPKLISPPEQF